MDVRHANLRVKVITMAAEKFRALVVRDAGDKKFTRSVEERNTNDLPEGNVLVKVAWSSLNYKDALSASGNRGVTRNFPHTPGIDAAGVVEKSENAAFSPGDEVIVTSYDLGMNTSGGFAEYIRVPADWVVPLPAGLSLRESMILGTAGFTAGMSVFALSQTVKKEQGEILVTGATGGVGSLAIAILAKLGYSVAAVSGKADSHIFLKDLGAARVLTRQEAADASGKPLLKTLWSGVVDTVGGEILATAIKSTDMRGVVTCCGNVASPDLPLTVFPFILRGVALAGIDSQNCPKEYREQVWQRLATDWKPDNLNALCKEVGLNDLEREIALILDGGQLGRVIVNLNS